MASPSRQSVRLDGRWRARVDADDRGIAEAWQRDGDAAFDRCLQVPLAWQAADPSLRQYAGAVWYRCNFQVPHHWRSADTELALRFDAVDYRVDVWLNNTYVGEHEGGYTPFEVDITHVVREDGAKNTLTLRVFDPTDLAEIPHGKQGGGWYTRVSGPWQSVWLLARPWQRILGARCFPRLEGSPRAAVVSVHVSARLRAGASVRVFAEVIERSGNVAANRHALADDEHVDLELLLRVDEAHLWQPDDPYLYRLRLTLLDDTLEMPLGIRTVEARDGRLLLNGRPLYVRGALDQAYWPETLYTPPSVEAIEREIQLAKEMGLNLLRKHIKPEDPRYLDACDRLGMLIWAEPANPDQFSPAACAAVRRDLLEMIDRDFNRPSIIVWSLYNEDWGVPKLWHDTATQDWVSKLYREVKAVDPTRLVCDNSGWAHLAGATDLNDYHEYFAVPERTQAFRERLDFIEQHPDDNFARGSAPSGVPVLISEWGNWALVDPRNVIARSGDTEPAWFDFAGRYQSASASPDVAPPALSVSPDVAMRHIHSVESRFHQLGLDRIFGDLGELADHAQARALRALASQIGEMRRRPAIQGYVVTELTDIEWECNGWLDYWRTPKRFHSQLAELNAPLALIATPHRPNAWAEDLVRVELTVSNTTEEPFIGSVHWRLLETDLAGAVPAAAAAFTTRSVEQPVLFRAPLESAPRLARLELNLLDRNARVCARTSAELAFAPRLSGRADGVWAVPRLHNRVFRQRLERHGMRLSRNTPLDDAPLIIADRLDEQIWAALHSGSHVLYLASDTAEGADLAGLRVRALSRGESWRMSAGVAWARADRLAPAPISAEVGCEVSDIFPLQVLEAESLAPGDEQLAGWFEGWLANAGATIILRQVGRGRLLVSTFRVEDSYGLDPVATLLLNREVGLLMG